MKSSSKSKSARNKSRRQNETKQKQHQKQSKKQRWGGEAEDLQTAILNSIQDANSEDLANKLASEEGGIAEQSKRLQQFERQKEQKEQKEREQRQREQEAKRQKEQRQKEQKERERQKQKERERERSREAHRSRERSKQARRENQEAERRIANKVREGLVDRAVALETIRDGRAAIEIAKLNENLRAALQPGILGPFGVPKWPSSGHKWPKDDDDDGDDDDDEEDGAFAFNTACQALSATGECDSRTMQRYPPTKSVCWVHEAAPASVYGSMLSSIVEFWRKRPSEKHESKTKRLYQKVSQRYMDEGRTESPISIAAKVIGTCIYVWGSVSGTTRWTVYHTETGECSLSSRAPVYLVMYATSTPGKYRYARIKPHTKGTTLPGSLVH